MKILNANIVMRVYLFEISVKIYVENGDKSKRNTSRSIWNVVKGIELFYELNEPR